MSPLDDYGPWALVTGASEGIGKALARELAAQGLSLVLVARRGERLQELANELRRDRRVETLVLALDLARPEAIVELDEATRSLDVGLVVAAAGFGSSGSFLDSELDNEIDMLNVNCRAALEMSHVFGQRLRERGRGGLILMSSLLAFQGVPRASNYAATKAYIQSLAEALHIELAPHGVDVVASAPGPVRSGFAERADMTMSMTSSPEAVAKGTLRALGRRTTVRPGALSKALEWSLKTLPRPGRVRILQQVMRGMTQESA
ncbi:MAG: SDR family oxidoreductase [Acidobacteriota bacterium]